MMFLKNQYHYREKNRLEWEIKLGNHLDYFSRGKSFDLIAMTNIDRWEYSKIFLEIQLSLDMDWLKGEQDAKDDTWDSGLSKWM